MALACSCGSFAMTRMLSYELQWQWCCRGSPALPGQAAAAAVHDPKIQAYSAQLQCVWLRRDRHALIVSEDVQQLLCSIAWPQRPQLAQHIVEKHGRLALVPPQLGALRSSSHAQVPHADCTHTIRCARPAG